MPDQPRADGRPAELASSGVLGLRPAVSVHGLFIAFGILIAAFFPFLTIYLEHKGLRAGQIGLALAVMALVRVFLMPLWGHLADTRLGRLTALQIGAVGAAVAAISMVFAEGVAAVVAAGTLISTFMVATGPNVDSIALEYLGAERMADYGHMRGWESLSYAGGCLVFGAILQGAGLPWAMPLYAAAAIGLLLWSATVPRDRPKRSEEHGRLGAVGAVFREAPRFWGFLGALVLLWTGFNAAWSFFSLKIADQGGGPLLIGIGTALGGLVEVPTMRTSTRLQRRFGLRTTYMLGCGVYALGFFLWGAVSNPTLLSVLTVLEGLGFGLIFTTGVVIVGRLLPPSLYATGNSVAGMVAFGIGPIIGAGIGGSVYEHAGPSVLFTGASAFALAAGAVAWFALSTPALSQPMAALPEVEAGAGPEPGLVP
jgi:PPP family 3-phenylpropionic acid transporter